jgi:hypothetical protein
MTSKSLKYTATRTDIVNDFYDEIQRLFEKYRYQREAVCALDDIESLAIWWANTPAVWWENAPAVVRPKDPGATPEMIKAGVRAYCRADDHRPRTCDEDIVAEIYAAMRVAAVDN